MQSETVWLHTQNPTSQIYNAFPVILRQRLSWTREFYEIRRLCLIFDDPCLVFDKCAHHLIRAVCISSDIQGPGEIPGALLTAIGWGQANAPPLELAINSPAGEAAIAALSAESEPTVLQEGQFQVESLDTCKVCLYRLPRQTIILEV